MLSTPTQMVHSSTGLALQSRSLGASYDPSLCRSRVSLGQNIECCVLVAVMMGVTFWAIPFTNRQWQRFNNVSATRAAFAARKPAVNFDKFLSVPFTFVFKKSNEHSERSIRETTSKGVVLDHSSQIQILDTDYIESTNEIGSNFLYVVHAGISNMRMGFSNTKFGALTPVTTFLTTSDYTLSLGKFSFSFLQELWVGNTLAVRKRSQSTDAEVNANSLVSFGQFSAGFVNHEGHEVAACMVLLDCYCGRVTFERARPMDVKSSELRDHQVSITGIPFERALGVFGRLWPVLLFERGISCTFFKEVAKRCLKMTKGLLNRNTGNLVEPSVVWSSFEISECGRASTVRDFLSCMIRIGSKSQSPIVDIPASAERLRKNVLLFGCRVKPIPISHLHTLRVACVKKVVQLLGAALPPLPEDRGLRAEN